MRKEVSGASVSQDGRASLTRVTRDEVEDDRKVANLFWSQSYEFDFATNEKSISFSFSS